MNVDPPLCIIELLAVLFNNIFTLNLQEALSEPGSQECEESSATRTKHRFARCAGLELWIHALELTICGFLKRGGGGAGGRVFFDDFW